MSAIQNPTPRRWTREEYHRAADVGLIRPEERLELVKGEILQKFGERDTPHATALRKTTDALEAAFASGFDIRPQLPLALAADSEPEPDVAAVAGSVDDFPEEHPTPEQTRLVVEISDSTLSVDRGMKAALYAEAGIPEY